MKNIFIIIVLFLSGSLSVNSQNTFLKTYPYWSDPYYSDAYAVITHPDGFTIGGIAQKTGFPEDNTVYLIRTDLNGDTLWSRTFTFIYTQIWMPSGYLKLITDHEGNYYFNRNELLVKISPTGDSLWSKSFGDQLISAMSISNNNKILLGTRHVFDWCMYILSTSGEIQSQFISTSNPGMVAPTTITEMSNGNLALICLYEQEGWVGYYGANIYTFNSSGDSLSSVNFQIHDDYLFLRTMIAVGSDELIGIGSSFDHGSFCIRLNLDGHFSWMKETPSEYDLAYHSIIRNNEGEYIVLGNNSPVLPGWYNWRLTAFTGEGNSPWSRVYSNSYSDSTFILGNSMALCPDGGYAIVGDYQLGSGYGVPMLLTTTDSGTYGVNKIPAVPFHTYPNPSTDQLTIENPDFGNGNSRVEITSLTGKKLDEWLIIGDKITIPVHSYSKGIYIISVYNEKQLIGKQKFIKQ